MRCCIKLISGNWPPRIVTKATIIEPATVDIPAVRRINNSLLVSLERYGLIKRGAST